eukprot:2290663-Pyramimonas_sp.AAC.1
MGWWGCDKRQQYGSWRTWGDGHSWGEGPSSAWRKVSPWRTSRVSRQGGVSRRNKLGLQTTFCRRTTARQHKESCRAKRGFARPSDSIGTRGVAPQYFGVPPPLLPRLSPPPRSLTTPPQLLNPRPSLPPDSQLCPPLLPL